MIYIWEAVVDVVFVVAVAGVGVATYKIAKSAIKKHKQKKAIKQQSQDKEQTQENIQTKSKFKTKNNILRTAENYNPTVIKSKKYQTLRSNIAEGTIEADYIKSVKTQDGKAYDNRTYIQCYDQDKAKQFEKSVENNPADDFAKPIVYQINFAEGSGMAPLIVSASNKKVYIDGCNLLVDKTMEIIEEYSNSKQLFPIQTIEKQSKNTSLETYNNASELVARFTESAQVEETEKQI